MIKCRMTVWNLRCLEEPETRLVELTWELNKIYWKEARRVSTAQKTRMLPLLCRLSVGRVDPIQSVAVTAHARPYVAPEVLEAASGQRSFAVQAGESDPEGTDDARNPIGRSNGRTQVHGNTSNWSN